MWVRRQWSPHRARRNEEKVRRIYNFLVYNPRPAELGRDVRENRGPIQCLSYRRRHPGENRGGIQRYRHSTPAFAAVTLPQIKQRLCGFMNKWRDGRAVEGARLESVYTPKSVSRVRIPLSPPIMQMAPFWGHLHYCLSVTFEPSINKSRFDNFARSEIGRPKGARRASAMDGASQSLSLRQANKKGPIGPFFICPVSVGIRTLDK